MTQLRTTDVDLGRWVLRTHQVGDPTDPTILWLHGSGPGVSALSNWEGILGRLPGYHHVAPDLLGFGESSHPADLPLGVAHSAEERANAILQLLDVLGIQRTHVVGNSMGGMVSLLLLTAQPDRFDRAILMGSGGAPMTPTPDLLAMVKYYDDPTPEAMLSLIKAFLFDTSRYGDAIEQIATDRARYAARPDISRSHERTFSPQGPPLVFTAQQLAGIHHEVLLLHGREDRIIPLAASHHLAQHLPNAQLHVLPHTGHWVQIEQADRFIALAQLFLGEAPLVTEAEEDPAA